MHNLSYGVYYNQDKVLVGWIFFIVVSFITFKCIVRSENLESILVTFLYYLYYLPSSSSYYINDTSFLFIILFNIYWLFLTLLLNTNIKMTRTNKKKELNEKVSNRKFIIVALILCFAAIFYSYKYNNGFNFVINLVDVYDARAAFMGTTTVVTSFILHFGGSIVIPALIMYSLKHKNVLLLVISLISQMALFSIAMEKGRLLRLN